MKNFLFLGFAIPDKEMKEIFKVDKFPAVQTHKFIWNIIKGIEYQNRTKCEYISVKPISDYPFFKKKYIKKEIYNEKIFQKEIKITSIPFWNTSILKILTRFISSFFYSLKYYNSCRNKGGIIVYSVHIPFMLTGLLISKIYKVPYIAIWTDPPAIITERESKIKTKLRGIELKISRYLMRKVDKAIVITKYLAEDFLQGKPYLIIEGIIDEACENNKNIEKELLKKIVYTGSLEKRYGIKNIVEGFIKLNNKNIVLEVYGRGDYEKELSEISDKFCNIKYMGFLPNEKILEIQKKATFLINARGEDEEYVKYSFPSKTLEYMLSGTPLISTMLPGIPEEYKEYFYILEKNDPEVISKKIEELLKLSYSDRKRFGEKAKKFALTKNYKQQGEKIVKFLLEGDK